MSFLKNLNKNGFKSFSERAIDNLQKKDLIEGRMTNKVEKLATNKSSGITKFDDLSKAGYGNTDMGRREVQSGNDNYFKNNFINPNNKTKEIEISFITNAIIDGNTYYYILDTEGKKYKCSVKVSKNKLPFINVTSKISISYSEEKEMTEILKIN